MRRRRFAEGVRRAPAGLLVDGRRHGSTARALHLVTIECVVASVEFTYKQLAVDNTILPAGRPECHGEGAEEQGRATLR